MSPLALIAVVAVPLEPGLTLQIAEMIFRQLVRSAH